MLRIYPLYTVVLVFSWFTTSVLHRSIAVPLGGLAADLHRRLKERPLSRPQRAGFELVAALCLGGSLLLIPSIASWASGMPVERDHFHRYYLLFGALWSVLLVSHLHGLGWIARGLALPPLRFIGVISFGLYLWHLSVTVVSFQRLPGGPALRAWGVGLACVAVATITYLAVERPFQRMRLGPLDPRARAGDLEPPAGSRG